MRNASSGRSDGTELEGPAIETIRGKLALVGGFRFFFALHRKAVDRTLSQFIADIPKLDTVEVEELRFDRSTGGESAYQQMRVHKAAALLSRMATRKMR
ncbi:hypothetical protein BGZ46_005197 [Entomortierella lignicola]|nr:hypothetical protein BGZ46_005197 [Entomortierella lignicola]